jgi:5-methylcytosine-specific restriction endonuclease McrA
MPWRPKSSRPPAPRREKRSAATIAFNNRTYGRKWKAFRLQYLALNPLCSDCAAEGRVGVASEPHHLVKVKDDPSRQYDHDNLLALCKRHHSIRTSRGQ